MRVEVATDRRMRGRVEDGNSRALEAPSRYFSKWPG